MHSSDFALVAKEQAEPHRDGFSSSPAPATNRGVEIETASAEKGSAGSKRSASMESTMRGKVRGKMDADIALETLVGHEVYVCGTGCSRELRRDGVLRKVNGL